MSEKEEYEKLLAEKIEKAKAEGKLLIDLLREERQLDSEELFNQKLDFGRLIIERTKSSGNYHFKFYHKELLCSAHIPLSPNDLTTLRRELIQLGELRETTISPHGGKADG